MAEKQRDLTEDRTLPQRLSIHLRQTAPGRLWYRYRRNRMADVFILSFPKCGRTWLRMMLGRALTLHFGIEADDLLELDKLAARHPGIPLIRFKHDDDPHCKSPDELVTVKTEYRDRPVIFLVRDVRDTIVSAYFQLTKREAKYRFHGMMSEFLHCNRASVDTIIRFYNIWADQRHVPASFMLMRYEDMHAQTGVELRRALDFIGVPGVADGVIEQAVAYSSFENMRRIEQGDGMNSFRLQPTDRNDPESFKTRRGKVGGYVDYLSESEIAELNDKIRRELNPVYGY